MLVPDILVGWQTAPRAIAFPLILGLLALGGSTVHLCLGSSIAVFVFGRLLVDTVGQKEIGRATGLLRILPLPPWLGYYASIATLCRSFTDEVV